MRLKAPQASLMSLANLAVRLLVNLLNLNRHQRKKGARADYEKFVPSPEDDGYGNLTVGYGHVVKKTETFGAITQEEALSLLATDLSYAEEYVTNYSASIGIIWDQNQYDAFVSLAYNSGGNFKYVMDEIVAGTDPYTAFSTIIYASGQKSLGLYRRRMDEADMFVNGTYNRTYRDW